MIFRDLSIGSVIILKLFSIVKFLSAMLVLTVKAVPPITNLDSK